MGLAHFRLAVLRAVIRVNSERGLRFSVFGKLSFRSDENDVRISDPNFFYAFYERFRESADIVNGGDFSIRAERCAKKGSFLVSGRISESSEFRGGGSEIRLVVPVAVEIGEFDEMHRRRFVVRFSVKRNVPRFGGFIGNVPEVQIAVSLRYGGKKRFSIRFAETAVAIPVVFRRSDEPGNNSPGRRSQLVQTSRSDRVVARSHFSAYDEAPVFEFAEFLNDISVRKRKFRYGFRIIVKELRFYRNGRRSRDVEHVAPVLFEFAAPGGGNVVRSRSVGFFRLERSVRTQSKSACDRKGRKRYVNYE